MNREIKFRVWDTVDKRFLWFFSSDTMDKIFGQSHSDKPLPEREGRIFVRKESEYILQQSTGLKDKLGNPIFEDDIVVVRFHHSNPPSKRPVKEFIDVNIQVVFDDGAFRLKDYEQRSTGYGTTYGYWWRSCEVVGNVHQHPHLLTSPL